MYKFGTEEFIDACLYLYFTRFKDYGVAISDEIPEIRLEGNTVHFIWADDLTSKGYGFSIKKGKDYNHTARACGLRTLSYIFKKDIEQVQALDIPDSFQYETNEWLKRMKRNLRYVKEELVQFEIT